MQTTKKICDADTAQLKITNKIPVPV